MLANFVSLILFSVLYVNLVESKPNCQTCILNSLNYIDHYKYLDCKPIANKDCPQCIDYFNCSTLPLETGNLDAKKCHVATQTYSVGESILSKRRFCKYCTCVDVALPPKGETTDNEDTDDSEDDEETQMDSITDFNATAILMSRKNKPPPTYSPLKFAADSNYEARVACAVSDQSLNTIINSPDSNEYCFYKVNECYSTKHCVSKEKLEKENCQYQGKKYAFGETIYPDEEDRCLKCKCGPTWSNNANQMTKQCERFQCDLEDSSLNQGCIPIYENKCCPNNYYCPPDEVKTPEQIKPGKCYFNGQNYDIGTTLKTDNPCLECNCSLPPYHTCVIKEKCDE